MSLDVSLLIEGKVERKSSGIFVRRDGQTIEITREEWDEMNPGCEPTVVDSMPLYTNEVFSWNITHNLTQMADEAGLYMAMWRPHEIGIERASQLVQPLTDGLTKLKADPEKYKIFNPPNGWGNYEGLVRFTEAYLEACRAYPDAKIEVCR